MKACARLHDYRDGLLQGPPRASFEAHLAECEKCRQSIALWSALERELGEMDREGKQNMPRTSAWAAQELVARARGERGMTFAPRLVAVAAAIAVVIVGVALFLARTGEEPAAEGRGSIATPSSRGAVVEAVVKYISPTATETVDLALAPGEVIPAAEESRTLLLLGRDRIGLDQPTRAVLAGADERQVRLKLLAGTVACEVAPRGEGQEFVVEAGEVTVRVVGTRFMVSRTEGSTTVLVDEGAVEIHRRGKQPETTKAGQGLEILAGGAAKRIEASPEARAQLDQLVAEHQREQQPHREIDAPEVTPSTTSSSGPPAAGETGADRGSRAAGVETWRAWVLAGRYDDAERALTAHLARHPRDAEALVLLADCRRKAGRWRAAVSAYERLIETAAPSRANMARFQAGVLYQERLGEHAAAAQLFEGYLRSASAKPLKSEAMLRLGKSLLALGRTQRAEAVLRETAARQDGSMASVRARELLEKIAGGKQAGNK